MRGSLENTWLRELEETRQGCFFYTTEEEFVSISRSYIQNGIQNIKERILWVLPPHYSVKMAKGFLEAFYGEEVESFIRMKRLLLLTWNSWFGKNLDLKKVTRRSLQYALESYQAGFEGLRILSHAPSKYSEEWGSFLDYHKRLKTQKQRLPYISFTAYSLIDCPMTAISDIAEDHSLCLIHYGSEWEWLRRTDSDLRTCKGGEPPTPHPQALSNS